MQKSVLIRIKAVFLLLVFTTNTLVGLACSLGLNMGFNANHHHQEENEIKGSHGHHHDEAPMGHSHSKKEKGNCCNDEVIKFAQVDKSAPQSVKACISPIFFTAFVSSFYSVDLLNIFQTRPASKYFLRGYHPPIADIRIAIQSFQI